MKKTLSVLLALVMTICMLMTTAMVASAAETDTKSGIEATLVTDKNAYSSGEDINVTVNVKNTNTYDVNDVSITVELPEGLTLKSGDLSISDVDIAAGETYSKEVVAVKETSTPPTDNPTDTPTDKPTDKPADTPTDKPSTGNPNTGNNGNGNATSPQTGDNSNIVLWVVFMMASAAGIFLTVKFRKKATKFLSLFLCVVMVCAIVPTGAFAAEGDTNTVNITVDKTITVDGTEIVIKASIACISNDDATDKEDTEITEEDKYILSASEYEVLAESNEKITFYVNSTLTIPYFELYIDDDNTGIKLYDDGDDTYHSDDIPNDGCYSGTYSINISDERDITFTAKAMIGNTEITTNEIGIYVYYELTDTEIDEMREIDARIQSILSSVREEYSSDSESNLIKKLHDAIMTYLEGEAADKVESIIDDADNYMITFIYRCSGVSGGVIYKNKDNTTQWTPDDGFFNGTSSQNNNALNNTTNSDSSININYITYREKALLLCYDTLIDGWNGGTFEDTVENVGNLLSDAGFSVDARYSVTVDDFKHMQDYDYIIVECHGSFYSIRTGLFTSETTPVICTPQSVLNKPGKEYSADLKKHRIASVSTVDENDKPNGTYYWIRPSFFNFYYSDNPLNANIVSLGCCKGAYTEDLVNAIVSAGAQTVLAYSDTVYTAYDYKMTEEILNQLCTGNTVSEALSSAKSKYGENDLVWGEEQKDSGNKNFSTLKSERAVCNIYGSASTKIHHSLLNGNFDSALNWLGSSLVSWKIYGDARSVYKLSGIKPKSFPKMTVISSGFGSMNDETTSCIYQTILVPNNTSTIEFSYDVVSEEPLEYVGTQYNDVFQVDILNTDGTLLDTLALESVNTSKWFAIDGIDFPGGDETTYHTRWKTVTSDAISKYRGQLIVLRFTVQDAGDAIYDTAALIDSVNIK